MNWTNMPAAENEPGQGDRPGQKTYLSPATPPQPQRTDAPSEGVPVLGQPPEIRIDKRTPLTATVGHVTFAEVFTLTVEAETIELIPARNWSQLDHHKWTARGKLPAEPAGLEVAADHVKIFGSTITISDPAGCAKLERVFNEWLRLEKQTAEMARRKAHSQAAPSAQGKSAEPEAQPLRFHVEVDKRDQVHIHCLRGKETLASIGLNVAGFRSLQQQGLLRKAHSVVTGALRDWVELDGELFSFEKGRNDAARLEQVLNERYVPPVTTGTGKEVAVYPNLVSPTGFDIMFPVVVAGALGIHRYHLNDQSLELLQDPQHCGLLHKELIVKLIPPNLIFKRKTPDGGEQYLAVGPETSVSVVDEEGRSKTIDLHQPLNLLRLSAGELTAIFNHPAINRHRKIAPPSQPTAEPAPPPAAAGSPVHAPVKPVAAAPASAKPELAPERPKPAPGPAPSLPAAAAPPIPPKPAATAPAEPPPRAPNAWLKQLLARPSLPHDWFAFLCYSKMAEWFGNSTEGSLGPCDGWYIALGETEDIADPEFKGVFLTGKGSLGFLGQGRMARFYNRVAFVGPRESALEGIDVSLVAVGLDAQGRVVFITSNDYSEKFGVPQVTLASELSRMRECGAIVMSIAETLASREPIEVVWSVPAEQADPADPQAQENVRPDTG